MSRMVLMGGVALVASFVMGATAIGAAQQPKPIPNFMFVGSGWLGQGGTNFIQPKSGPGPIKNDPKFPYVGNNDDPGQPVDRARRRCERSDPSALGSRCRPAAQRPRAQGQAQLRRSGALLARRRSRAIAVPGRADLLHPAAARGPHHLAARSSRAPRENERAALGESETVLVRRLRRPLRRRHARGRHDRLRHASISLRRQFPHAAQRAAPRGRALAHDRRRKASRSRSDGRGSEGLHHAVEGDAGSGRRWTAVRCWNRCAPRTTSTRSTSTNTRCRKPRRRTSKPIGARRGPSIARAHRRSSRISEPLRRDFFEPAIARLDRLRRGHGADHRHAEEQQEDGLDAA